MTRAGELLRLVDRAVAEVPADIAEAVRGQAVRARVVAEVEGRRIDVEEPDDVLLVPAADGPLRPVMSVVGPDGQPIGELLVWVRGGRFTGLERPWWTDEAPDRWPAPEDVRGSAP